jgi:predicted nucleic acid-binding protein
MVVAMQTIFERIKQQKVYFDTNPLIYYIEGHEAFFDVVLPFFEMIGRNEIVACTSEFTLAEILIKPMRENLQDTVDAYQGLLVESGYFTLLSANVKTFIQAAAIGGATGMRTPDAIHLAVALENECAFFITNDRKIKSVGKLEVIYLSNLDSRQ